MDSKSRAKPYRNRLTYGQIAKGISATKQNAIRLLEDARTLYKDNRYPTACSLSVLVVEEVAKLPILRRMALASKQEEWRRCWKDFSSHLDKAAHWIIPFLVNEAKSVEEFTNSFHREVNGELLNSLKQFGFYLGCYGNAHWAEPHLVIEKENASPIIHSAEVLVFGSQSSLFDTEEAIAAWADHMHGMFECDSMIANDSVVTFLKQYGSSSDQQQEKIPHNIAFEFMSTVLYLSAEYSPHLRQN